MRGLATEIAVRLTEYRRYVFWTIRSRIPRKFLPSIFPNLALCISHGDHDDIDTRSYPVYRLLHGTKVVGASVYRPVSFFFLLCHILQAPIRQLAKSPDQSAPSVSLPCYLATLQIYNSAYVYEDARMNSSDFDVDRIILRPLRTLVQFHAPKPQRSRDRVAQDFGPERAQRNARTFLSLLKLAGRSSSLTETTSSVHSPPPAWNSSEYLEAYTQGGGFRLTDPPYIATTLDKDEFAQMMIRVSTSSSSTQLLSLTEGSPYSIRNRFRHAPISCAADYSWLEGTRSLQRCLPTRSSSSKPVTPTSQISIPVNDRFT